MSIMWGTLCFIFNVLQIWSLLCFFSLCFSHVLVVMGLRWENSFWWVNKQRAFPFVDIFFIFLYVLCFMFYVFRFSSFSSSFFDIYVVVFWGYMENLSMDMRNKRKALLLSLFLSLSLSLTLSMKKAEHPHIWIHKYKVFPFLLFRISIDKFSI